MSWRRWVTPQRRNARLAGFVLLVLGMFVLALLLGFLLGRIVGNLEEPAPPLPPARSLTVEETVRAPEETIEKTVQAPEKTVPATTATASATASP